MATPENSIKESFLNKHPRKWDYGIMATLATGLLAAVIYIVTSEVTAHNGEEHAHPLITRDIAANTESLKRIEANQVRDQAMSMDARICDDPQNSAYRRELARLIDLYEKLTGRRFPHELLRCAR